VLLHYLVFRLLKDVNDFRRRIAKKRCFVGK
jgi:hypothetical protein